MNSLFGISDSLFWVVIEYGESCQTKTQLARIEKATLEFCVKSTSNISRICTMSSLISKKLLTEYGMQPYGPPCGSTISVQI